MQPIPAIDGLVQDILALQMRHQRRIILGIAGIPGSGKSTLAAKLVSRINARNGDFARLIPMDGFHLTNDQLHERQLIQRKGAPETFDAERYISLLTQVRHDPQATLTFPIYDRHLHEPRFTEQMEHRITSATDIVITEGNYLLLPLPPWAKLVDVLDECWFLETPVEQARTWLLDRHIRGGKTWVQALQHYERTDGLNTQLVMTRQRRPDRVVKATALTGENSDQASTDGDG